MKTIIIADNQDITAAGIKYLCGLTVGDAPVREAKNKCELTQLLCVDPDAVVALDYTLFDIGSADELLILHERFVATHWILISDDLSSDFMRKVYFRSDSFSIVLKECALKEIETALIMAFSSKRYVCSRAASIVNPKKCSFTTDDSSDLTPSEIEILKLIALGRTTKEIAEERFSSTHTISTHRKNIFRKTGVNNVHEATKYALRAGIVDLADYYI
jgi:DNA-binding NarL/FixJ family response regulator